MAVVDGINYTQYGGYTDLDFAALGGVYSGGGPGYYGVGKIGNRWVWVDPLGKAMLLRGFYKVNIDDHLPSNYGATGPTSTTTYRQNITAKYGSLAAWQVAIVDRIKQFHYNCCFAQSLGFGTALPGVLAKSVAIYAAHQPYCMGLTANDEAIHNILADCAAGIQALGFLPLNRNASQATSGRFFPDCLDPKYAERTAQISWSAPNQALLFLQGDDGDYVSQLWGAGHTNETGVAPNDSNWCPHGGFIALICEPTRASQPSFYNNSTNTWSVDPTVYAKKVLIDDLKAKYGTIAALNAAWGSNYTTFDSDGGWGIGNGLQDEDGMRPRAWLGKNSPAFYGHTGGQNNAYDSTSWSPAVKIDLDAHLYKMSVAWLKPQAERIHAQWPEGIYIGSTGIGGAGAPARAPVLLAHKEWVNLIRSGPGAAFDYTMSVVGDLPVLDAAYKPCQTQDSDLWWVSASDANAGAPTQELRGASVASLIQAGMDLQTPSGVYAWIGYQHWNIISEPHEKRGWGPISWQDNFFDGRDYRTSIPDPYTSSVMTIPEDPNHGPYGDTMTAIKNAHVEMFTTLQAQLGNPEPDPEPQPEEIMANVNLTITLQSQSHPISYTGMGVRFERSTDSGATWVSVQDTVRPLGTTADSYAVPTGQIGKYRGAAYLTDGTNRTADVFSNTGDVVMFDILTPSTVTLSIVAQ